MTREIPLKQLQGWLHTRGLSLSVSYKQCAYQAELTDKYYQTAATCRAEDFQNAVIGACKQIR